MNVKQKLSLQRELCKKLGIDASRCKGDFLKLGAKGDKNYKQVRRVLFKHGINLRPITSKWPAK